MGGFMRSVKPCRLIFDSFDEAKIMAGSRRLIELSIKRTEGRGLESIARSRTEAAGRVGRARVLLAYRQDPSFYAGGEALGMHHQKVRRYIERAKADGAMAALDERPRPGKEPTITVEAKTWVVALACRKPKELGYPHEVWTTRLLAEHAREHGPRQGHACLSGPVHGLGPGRGGGPPAQPRVHRVSQADRCRLSYPDGDPSDPRQSFRTHLQGDESLARQPTGGPLRIHLHAQARLLAQPGRGLLLQARSLRPATHPRRIQTGTQGPHHGRHGSLQRKTRRPYLVLQTQKSRLI